MKQNNADIPAQGGQGLRGGKLRANLAAKLVGMLVLTVLLLVPLALVQEQIDERSRYREQAVEEVSRSFAGAQKLVGPVLALRVRQNASSSPKEAKLPAPAPGGQSRQAVARPGRQCRVFFPAEADGDGGFFHRVCGGEQYDQAEVGLGAS